MTFRVVNVSASNKGLPYDSYLRRILGRSDLELDVIHLTKPTLEDTVSIMRSNMTYADKLDSINTRATDRLIKILAEGTLYGSTTKSGFIIGDTPAVCFQEVPYPALYENILMEQEVWRRQRNRIRYCGVGLSFDRFFVYEKGARPVFYEEKRVATQILPPDQHWRIVSLDLERKDPYLENFWCDDGKPCKSHELQTTIIDWTHEREWRLPGDFYFDLNAEFQLNNHM